MSNRGLSRLGGAGVKSLAEQNTDRVSAFAPIATEIDAVPRTDATCHSRHIQRSKLQFYSITSSAHFPVSNVSAKLGPADDEMVIARQLLRSKASD